MNENNWCWCYVLYVDGFIWVAIDVQMYFFGFVRVDIWGAFSTLNTNTFLNGFLFTRESQQSDVLNRLTRNDRFTLSYKHIYIHFFGNCSFSLLPNVPMCNIWERGYALEEVIKKIENRNVEASETGTNLPFNSRWTFIDGTRWSISKHLSTFLNINTSVILVQDLLRWKGIFWMRNNF